MAAWDIKGRDAFSATGGTGPIDFAPINIGTAAGAGASGSGLSPGVVMIGALVAVVLVVVLARRKK